jgi:hypothetical protein
MTSETNTTILIVDDFVNIAGRNLDTGLNAHGGRTHAVYLNSSQS